ncbi:hypothetical protein [Pseudonocardia acidicola]|uniref:hypothetical protein n=1 Tax=Pseudonocardia acidicola TaxID=2724939 RepID=UPI001B7D1490|nr:hypothetical protein [Pseudonocardia acidicola]
MVAGADDAEYGPPAHTVFAAVRAARVPVQLIVLPGGHTWQVRGPGLESALPWLGHAAAPHLVTPGAGCSALCSAAAIE